MEKEQLKQSKKMGLYEYIEWLKNTGRLTSEEADTLEDLIYKRLEY
jgi:hypothetical protein